MKTSEDNNVTGSKPELDPKKVVEKQVKKHFNNDQYFNDLTTEQDKLHSKESGELPNPELPTYPFDEQPNQKDAPKRKPAKPQPLPWESEKSES
jgi:hypothetical protein